MPNVDVIRAQLGPHVLAIFRQYGIEVPERGGTNRSVRCWQQGHDDRRPSVSVNVQTGDWQCFGCGASGSVFDLVLQLDQRLQPATFPAAVTRVAELCGLFLGSGGNGASDPTRPTTETLERRSEALLHAPDRPELPRSGAARPIEERVVRAYHDRLLAEPDRLAWLAERRGLTRASVERWLIGWDGQRYTIPIYDEAGVCWNLRCYLPDAPAHAVKMRSFRPGTGENRLLPESTTVGAADDPVVLCEGEWDCLLARQHGLNAVTTTGGAARTTTDAGGAVEVGGKWRDEWDAVFAGRTVVLAMDADRAGQEWQGWLARRLTAAGATVQTVDWGAVSEGYDLTDYLMGGGTAAGLVALSQPAPAITGPPLPSPAQDTPETRVTAPSSPEDRVPLPLTPPTATTTTPGDTDGDDGLIPPDVAERQSLLAALNDEFMVVSDRGKTLVWRTRYDEDGRIVYDYFTERDFRLLLSNRFVTDSEGRPKPLSRAWLEWGGRRQYDAVVFNPSSEYRTPPGTLNLWRGFALRPRAGSWDRMQSHLYEIVCNRDDDAYRYLRRWMARTIQRPELQGEVAIVLRGGKGAGKGVVGHLLLAPFGQHGFHVNNGTHLTGRFNGHLRDVCMLFVDEGFWAGDKQGESTLKALITEPVFTVESKFQNAVQVPNRLSILMASNADWVVPASRDERRFLVLDVADRRIGDRDYFRALWQELRSGGLEAFLLDMQMERLDDFEHRDVPDTDALVEQAVLSMEPIDQWWLERLTEGTLLGTQTVLPPEEREIIGTWATAPSRDRTVIDTVRVRIKALHADYLQWCDRHRINPRYRGHGTEMVLGHRLRKLLPNGWPIRSRSSAEGRQWLYVLPSLSICRDSFARGHAGFFSDEGLPDEIGF